MTDQEILNNACEQGKRWFEESGFATIQEAMDSGTMPPGYYFWCCQREWGLKPDPEKVDFCARAEPHTALEYCPQLLSRETLELYARARPAFALEYCPKLLSQETREFCAREKPAFALAFCPELLSPKTLELCARTEPAIALKFCPKLLSPETREYCEERRV